MIRDARGLVPYRRPRLALGEKLNVRIEPGHLKCVAFLCEERGAHKRRRKAVGTCFFVNVPCEEDRGLSWAYVVTARHCIEKCGRDSLFVRINKEDQKGYAYYTTSKDDWFLHSAADVAAIPSPVPLSRHCEVGGAYAASYSSGDLDYTACLWDRMVGPGPDYKCGSEGVQVGDELYSVGLFVQHYGKKRNLPVARFGHVSRMPDRMDIPIDQYGNTLEIVAYLAEFLSWGGFSGSPVFWLEPSPIRALEEYGPLLGLVSAHFGIAKRAKTRGDVLGQIKMNLNSGMAIITPAEAIRELLMSDELVQDRERRYQKHKERAAGAVELDSAQGDS